MELNRVNLVRKVSNRLLKIILSHKLLIQLTKLHGIKCFFSVLSLFL